MPRAALRIPDSGIFIDEKNENEIDNEILNMLKNSKSQ